MQIFQKADFQSFQGTKPIAIYLGRKIYLTRVQVKSADKGLWLHWCHPEDTGKGDALKHGRFCAPNQALEDALHEVYREIDATVELEMYYQQKLVADSTFMPKSSSKVVHRSSSYNLDAFAVGAGV
jgi:hypothetical protein